MGPRVAVIVFALTLAGYTAPTPPALVTGAVGVGPTCAPPSAQRRCADAPAANITVTFASTRQTSTTTTDSSGHFALTLAPAKYTIRLSGVNPALPQFGRIELHPMAGPEIIEVQPADHLDLSYRIFSGLA